MVFGKPRSIVFVRRRTRHGGLRRPHRYGRSQFRRAFFDVSFGQRDEEVSQSRERRVMAPTGPRTCFAVGRPQLASGFFEAFLDTPPRAADNRRRIQRRLFVGIGNVVLQLRVLPVRRAANHQPSRGAGLAMPDRPQTHPRQFKDQGARNRSRGGVLILGLGGRETDLDLDWRNGDDIGHVVAREQQPARSTSDSRGTSGPRPRRRGCRSGIWPLHVLIDGELSFPTPLSPARKTTRPPPARAPRRGVQSAGHANAWRS